MMVAGTRVATVEMVSHILTYFEDADSSGTELSVMDCI